MAIRPAEQVPKAGIADWLAASGIDPMRRAETLSVDEWVTVTRSAPPNVVAAWLNTATG